jgi:hypothetical protein
MHSTDFLPRMLGGIENGAGEYLVVYMPDDFLPDHDRLLVDGELFNAFTRIPDFPAPHGQVAWRTDDVAEVGPYQAFTFAE